MGRWGDGEMGRWGDGEIEKYLVMVEDGTFFPIFFAVKIYSLFPIPYYNCHTSLNMIG
ncbi:MULTISPECIES: hypothetical protein [unclassified Okeania]|uniref:hypothetical protein n=1 Tax=unclassified Okeania TaxID=2634635 RepID=UPI0013B9DAAB|nr:MULTISPECIES: hypothetical protein [unclassified Okeania]NES75392.1 hypothetical protein [Okeania sp. SIO1H4]NET17236.1 hypothetical protein [Okeania sp. SIO1H6]NET19070.1 hypothetical protein [Okeania sp. SIO1H5]NET92843.1 hypothetical protein [Okeania sp. SIO1H2]